MIYHCFNWYADCYRLSLSLSIYIYVFLHVYVHEYMLHLFNIIEYVPGLYICSIPCVSMKPSTVDTRPKIQLLRSVKPAGVERPVRCPAVQ